MSRILLLMFLYTASAMAQTSTLLPITDPPTHGADIATFRLGLTHFTFDLIAHVGGADWTGSELSLDVVGAGRLWHASDEHVLRMRADPTDPYSPLCFVHNLLTPGLVNDAVNRGDTRMYDTFFTAPGQQFMVEPMFASPGVPNLDPFNCPPAPPIVSTLRRLRGRNPQGHEIPLAWFDTLNASGSFMHARFTFEVPPGFGDLSLDSTGRLPFVRITGNTTVSQGHYDPFAYTIYQRFDCESAQHPAEPDCNGNGQRDICDVAWGGMLDCNMNGVPDDCDLASGSREDCNGNGVPDDCETDCNGNGRDDACDLADGASSDCDQNGVPDECDPDCNANGVPDACDLGGGTSPDCNFNAHPDECEVGGLSDCDGNGRPDLCDIFLGDSADCDSNRVPDECDIAGGAQGDCNQNGVPDACELEGDPDRDCNGNGVPDDCDIERLTSVDCNDNGIPDECDMSAARSHDCNGNGWPDECDVASGASDDCDGNDWPDECWAVYTPRAPLSALDGREGFAIIGVRSGQLAGYTAGGAGDVNGDGRADLILGVGGNVIPGEAFVVFGGAQASGGVLRVDELSGANGFRIVDLPGGSSGGFISSPVCGAGDVNGDGLADLLIGAPYHAVSGRANAGGGYVVFGASGVVGGGTLSVATLDGSNGFGILGHLVGGRAGTSVSAAGDFNGDGYGDVLIGAPTAAPQEHFLAGAAYVVFGGPDVGAAVDLALLDGANGSVLRNVVRRSKVGGFVARAGDVNGDGLADIVIGAPSASETQNPPPGAVYVVFGRRGPVSGGIIELDLLSGGDGFAVRDSIGHRTFGFGSAGIGDVDADGFDDVSINVGNGADAFVVRGGATFPAQFTTDELADGLGLRILAPGGVRALAPAGDFNDDGVADCVAISYDQAERRGLAAVGFGDRALRHSNVWDLTHLDGRNGVRYDAPPDVRLGDAAGPIGRFNADAVGDLLLSAPYEDRYFGQNAQTGSVYVLYGRRAPRDFNGNGEFDACECLGDVNGDGRVDIGDLGTMLGNFGTPSGMTLADGDLDGNGAVDLTDLSLLLSQFGTTCQ